MKFGRDGKRGPLLRLDQLDPYEKELIQQDLRARRMEKVEFDERGMARVQAEVMQEWGVMCPHPSSSLDPIGDLAFPSVDGKRLEKIVSCDACGAAVFPTKWRIELDLILAER